MRERKSIIYNTREGRDTVCPDDSNEMKRVLFIGAPFRYYAGGHKRNYYIMREFARMGVEVYLYVPIGEILEALYNDIRGTHDSKREMIGDLMSLKGEGVVLDGKLIYLIEKFDKERSNTKIRNSHGFRALFKKYARVLTEHYQKERFMGILNSADIIISGGGHMTRQISFWFAKNYQKPFTIILGIEPFKSKQHIARPAISHKENIITNLIFGKALQWYRNHYFPVLFKKYVKSGLLCSINSVSLGPIELSGLYSIVGFDTPINILPASAYEEIDGIVSSRKCERMIFVSRLTPEKGLFDIIYITKKIQKEHNVKLVVVGNFYSDDFKERFFSLARKYSINFEYWGFLTGKRLYSAIAESKLLLYPSHSDSFSQVLMLSLFMDTPVVAYAIPAFKSLYSKMSSVRLVPEWDYDQFAIKSLEILKKSDYDNIMSHDTEEERFYKSSVQSWEVVALNQLNQIKYDLSNYNRRKIL